MPKIKIVINPLDNTPVELAGKVKTGWKCPRTNKVFVTKQKYVRYLKNYAKESLERKRIIKKRNQQKEFFLNMRKTVESAGDIVAFVKNNWSAFVVQAQQSDWTGDRFARAETSRVRRGLSRDIPTITWMHMQLDWVDGTIYGARPLDGSKTSCGKGWRGRMEFQTTDPGTGTYEFGSDMWKGIGIHTYCGGYASNYYYQIELLAEDWPGMAKFETLNILVK